MSGPEEHSPGDDHPPAEPSDPIGPGGTDPDEPARNDRGQGGGTARPSATTRRSRSLPGRSRVRITMPTQADLDRLPAEVRMELRNQQRAERHQWLNSLGILFGVLFTAGSLVASGLALRTAQEDLRTSQDNVRIARESQLTDRYAKTLEPLTSDNTTIRLAAIHALNRLLADSQRDRAAITAVLAGFIRDRAPTPTTKDKDLPPEPSVDITAALTILASNPHPVPPLDLHGIRTPHSDLGNAHFNNANLGGADLRSSDLGNAHFNNAALGGADLRGSDLSKADLRDANLREADLSHADLRNANLTGAGLADADLSRAYMRGAHLSGADLSGARLSGHRGSGSVVYLRAGPTPADGNYGADLRGADLRGVNLYEADLRGAYLYEADLRGVNLDLADLRGADLRGARFSVGLDEVRQLAETDKTTRW
ncbi:pentapeptide repeat-containing protein [Actinomadura sp. 9N215]|uniref:pentapeptide repeat-containing protein n=1 Tax=Actinomadura sp. 9N215 TaxID=3375150 RepID=UPI0037B64675